MRIFTYFLYIIIPILFLTKLFREGKGDWQLAVVSDQGFVRGCQVPAANLLP
jgi:hypothetical protein